GIGQPPAGKRLGGQQMAEFVMDVRLGDRREREQGEPEAQGGRPDGQHRQSPATRQSAQPLFCRRHPSRAERGPRARYHHGERQQDDLEHPGGQGGLYFGSSSSGASTAALLTRLVSSRSAVSMWRRRSQTTTSRRPIPTSITRLN